MGGNAGINISEVVVGQNVQVQGSAIGNWKAYTTTLAGVGTATGLSATYRENGSSLDGLGLFTTGTVAASTATLTLPTGFTSLVGGSIVVGKWERDNTSANTPKSGTLVAVNGSATIYFCSDGAVGTLSPFSGANGNVLFANTEYVSYRFSVPVNELSSNVTLANRAVEEYSSNSNATNTASDTTSFLYGPGGSLIPNAAVGTAYARRVQFTTPVQSTDKLTLEVKTAAGNWISFQDAGYGVVTIGGKIYGAYISQVSSTAVDVNFGEGGIGAYSAATYGANGGPWSGLSTYLWRVRKTSGGASVGYPISSANIVGRVDGVAPASGMVGELVWENNVGNTTINAGVIRQDDSPTLGKGTYLCVHGAVLNSGTSGVLGAYIDGTSSPTNGFGGTVDVNRMVYYVTVSTPRVISFYTQNGTAANNVYRMKMTIIRMA
jgi:hypothetical protein